MQITALHAACNGPLLHKLMDVWAVLTTAGTDANEVIRGRVWVPACTQAVLPPYQHGYNSWQNSRTWKERMKVNAPRRKSAPHRPEAAQPIWTHECPAGYNHQKGSATSSSPQQERTRSESSVKLIDVLSLQLLRYLTNFLSDSVQFGVGFV